MIRVSSRNCLERISITIANQYARVLISVIYYNLCKKLATCGTHAPTPP